MKRTFIAAALLACAAPAMAADEYYYAPPPAAAIVTTGEYYHVEPDTIRAVQQRLLARGYTVRIDGVFDYRTADALKYFQQLQGFAPTAIIDQPTLTALGIPKAMPATVGAIPSPFFDPLRKKSHRKVAFSR